MSLERYREMLDEHRLRAFPTDARSHQWRISEDEYDLLVGWLIEQRGVMHAPTGIVFGGVILLDGPSWNVEERLLGYPLVVDRDLPPRSVLLEERRSSDALA